MSRIAQVAMMVILAGMVVRAYGQPVTVVAAENCYGGVAQQIGGRYATVSSILSNPDQDPHLFEVSISTARLLSRARVVIYNGLGYDAWMAKLLAATAVTGRETIVVADLLHKPAGANPHLWYDPAAMPALARVLAQRLAAIDPPHQAYFQRRLQALLHSLAPLQARIAALRSRYAGTPVTATEPVFGDMAQALGLVMRNRRFQQAVMNGVEPGASTIAAFERDLRQRRIRVLIYNRQATNEATRRLLGIARQVGIPVVGVTETQPPDMRYQDWMLSQLDALGKALAGAGQ